MCSYPPQPQLPGEAVVREGAGGGLDKLPQLLFLHLNELSAACTSVPVLKAVLVTTQREKNEDFLVGSLVKGKQDLGWGLRAQSGPLGPVLRPRLGELPCALPSFLLSLSSLPSINTHKHPGT